MSESEDAQAESGKSHYLDGYTNLPAERLHRIVIRALRSSIHAHGPIGLGQIGSAAKCIVSNAVAASKESD